MLIDITSVPDFSQDDDTGACVWIVCIVGNSRLKHSAIGSLIIKQIANIILNTSILLQKNTQQIEQDSLRDYSCHNDMWYSDKKNDIRSDMIFFRTWQSPGRGFSERSFCHRTGKTRLHHNAMKKKSAAGAFQSDRFATALAN
jgi:hypothetical protein